jgi:predicted metal-dependent phosphoesterase TrpH
MAVKADLHTHTDLSDGFHSPETLLQKAKAAGISILGITDHDNVSAFPAAVEIGREIGIEVIPGVELSAMVGVREVHILGYFIDYNNQRLLEYLQFFRLERVKRAKRIVEKLNHIKVPLKLESVLDRAGSGAVGRPHIATALVDEGLIATYSEAFDRFIGNGRPAFEQKFQFSTTDAIRLINAAGGISCIAHPGRSLPEEVMTDLIKSGIDGIEVIHPSHSPELVAHYRAVANEYFLLGSGGSDFHGGKRNDDDLFGHYYIDEDAVDTMKRRLFSSKSA